MTLTRQRLYERMRMFSGFRGAGRGHGVSEQDRASWVPAAAP